MTWVLPFVLLLTWMLPFILLHDVDDAHFFAVSGNAEVYIIYSRGTAAMFLSPYILHVSPFSFRTRAPPAVLTSPKWCPRVTTVACRAGCGHRRHPAGVAKTGTTLHVRGPTARSRGPLQGKRPLTVKFRRARPNNRPPARNHGRPHWRRSRSSGQVRKRASSPLTPMLASTSPLQARRSVTGWPPHPRQ